MTLKKNEISKIKKCSDAKTYSEELRMQEIGEFEKKFGSIKEICDKYNISQSLYSKRKVRGYTLDECLYGKKKNILYRDSSTGEEFYEYKMICNYYGIHKSTLFRKLSHGYTLDEICAKKTYRCSDHKGNRFSSVKEKCKFYNIKESTYRGRKKRGWSEEDSLTVSIEKHDG